jgi:hypothetical protein
MEASAPSVRYKHPNNSALAHHITLVRATLLFSILITKGEQGPPPPPLPSPPFFFENPAVHAHTLGITKKK